MDNAYTSATTIKADGGVYSFSGWMLNGALVTSVADVKDDLALTGTWTFVKDQEPPVPVIHSVTYSWDGAPAAANLPANGTVNDGETYTVDTAYTSATTIKANGGVYSFSGWMLKGALVTSVADVKDDLALTGTWTFVKNEEPLPPATVTYQVTYQYTGDVPAGFTAPVDGSLYPLNAEVTLASAHSAPANYTFGGWVLSDGLTAADGKFQMPEHNVTITGNWVYTEPEIEEEPPQETIPDRETPTTDLPTDLPNVQPEIIPGENTLEETIGESEIPLSNLPQVTEEETILAGEVPMGNLPQTGTTTPVDASLTLGMLALAVSLAVAGLTFSLNRKKEEET